MDEEIFAAPPASDNVSFSRIPSAGIGLLDIRDDGAYHPTHPYTLGGTRWLRPRSSAFAFAADQYGAPQ